MRAISAGRFRISISEPYPLWVDLYVCEAKVAGSFSHKELMDLKHCVDEAIRHARLELKRLGKDPEEVSR